MKTKMKPIIFNTELIPAIQNLKPSTWPPEPIDPSRPWKWQTRRTGGLEEVNNNNMTWELKNTGTLDYMVKKQYKGRFGAYFHAEQIGGKTLYVCPQICPYPPGTRLWVRETWSKDENGEYVYRANYGTTEDDSFPPSMFKWKPSIHMPREAARIFLEVKNVRVERIKEISNEDILAEGINDLGSYGANYDYFANEIWDNINGKKYPWENNDWVFVYEFMRRENYGKN